MENNSKYNDWFQIFLENIYSAIAAAAMGMLYVVAIIFSVGYATELGDTLIMQITLCIAMVALEIAGMAFWIKSLTAHRRRVKMISFVAAIFLLFLSWFGVMTMIIASDSHKELIDNDKAIIKIDNEIEALTKQRSVLLELFAENGKTKTKESIEDINLSIAKYQNKRELRERELPTASQIVFRKVENLLPEWISEEAFYILIKGLWAVAILGAPVLLHLCSLMDTEKVKKVKRGQSPTPPNGGPNGGKERTKKDDDITERTNVIESFTAPDSAPVTALKSAPAPKVKSAPPRTAPAAKPAQTGSTAKAQLCEREYSQFLALVKSGAVNPSYRAVKGALDFVKSDEKAGKFLNRAAKEGHLLKETQNNKTRFKLSGAVRTEMNEPQKLKLVR